MGRTGLHVHAVGFGSCAIGGADGPLAYGPADDESRAAIRAALDVGCNFFDTADVYGFGHSETLLGEVLRRSRASVIVAIKIGYDFHGGTPVPNFSPDYLRLSTSSTSLRG